MAGGWDDQTVSAPSAALRPTWLPRTLAESLGCARSARGPPAGAPALIPATSRIPARARYDTGPTVAPVGPARTTQIAFRRFKNGD